MDATSELLSCIADLGAYARLEKRYRLFYSNGLSIPQPLESRLSLCIYECLTINNSDLCRLRAGVDSNMGDAICVYAARMASLAIRNHEAQIVVGGMIALALDDDIVDYRDVLASLCLLCDASQRLMRFDPESINAILQLATPKRSRLLRRYVNSRVGVTTPEMMGFVPTGEGSSFLYRSTADARNKGDIPKYCRGLGNLGEAQSDRPPTASPVPPRRRRRRR